MGEDAKTQRSFIDLPARQDEPFWPDEAREDSAEERHENLPGQMKIAFVASAAERTTGSARTSDVCPDCGARMWLDGGCRYCRACGHSDCPLGDMSE